MGLICGPRLLPSDPQFIEKLRDVVGVYLNPPEAAVVFCVDEKSQVQAIDRTQPAFPILPGTPARRSHDYLRHGTTSATALPLCLPPWRWPPAR
jgi:hypothetical protein